MMRRLASLSCLVLLLSACGLSPQVVNVAPSPQADSGTNGRNAPVRVEVHDERPQQHIGSRGGVYPDTSLIRPANNVAKALYDAVTRSLQSMGYNALNPGDAATELQLRLTELSYVPAEGAVVNKVVITAKLEATARRGSAEHIGRYQSSVTHETPLTPSASRNEQMINDVLERTLNRLLVDPKMRAFLAGNDRP